MNALLQIEKIGVTVKPDGENLALDAPDSLTDELWSHALTLAKENKAEILKTVRDREEVDSKPIPFDSVSYVRDRARHVTQEMVKSWRIARRWILPRLSELEKAGWTRTRLFRAGRYSYPHGEWGVAWMENWRETKWEISLDDGLIIFSAINISGQKVRQVARP